MRRGRRPTIEGTPDLRTLMRVMPDLWPSEHPGLRQRVIVSLGFLILAKVAVLITPFVYRDAVDALAPNSETALLAVPVMLVVAYGVTRLAGTLFQQLRDLAFARVGQHALRQLGLRVFRHVHQLSLGYHISRKTGALSRVVDRGIKAIDFLLRYLLFSIVPLLFELGVVAIIFLLEFGFWYLAVMLLTISAYVAFTFKVTEWRVKIRKEMNDQDQDAHQKAVDSLLNYETVKYFSAERRESDRYEGAMIGYENAAVKTQTTLAFLNLGQSVIISVGLGLVMVFAATRVTAGTLTVGDFVLVNALMMQITMPLNFLGTVYREIRQSLIDMSDMFTLLGQPAEVQDKPGAKALAVTEGRVAFEKVAFNYEPERAILKGIDFTARGGGTVAVIGQSGAGKSTIARLLFRFYDVTGGRITIDGQDLRDVTQESLRQNIGVVPQDTVLFNDTIAYNIGYGDPNATTEQIEQAARDAAIHEFVEGLPDGYDTMVGERGLKLSGGEKQRVAIARAILKNPPILILDEATSALDSGTERDIQDSLRRLSENRTVVTIAQMPMRSSSCRTVRWSNAALMRFCWRNQGFMPRCGSAKRPAKQRKLPLTFVN